MSFCGMYLRHLLMSRTLHVENKDDEWRVSTFSFFMNRIEGALRHPSLVMTIDGKGLTIAAFSARFMSGLSKTNLRFNCLLVKRIHKFTC